MAEEAVVNETVETHLTANEDLFGDGPVEEVSEEQPEPSETESAETLEEPGESEEAETAETVEAEAKADFDADLLAFFEKKGFDRQKLEEYSERYRRTPEQFKADPQLKYLLLDKMNADKVIADKQKPEEVKPDQPAGDLDSHFKSVMERVTKSTDPKVFDYAVTQLENAKSTRDQLMLLSGFMENYLETVLGEKFSGVMQNKFGGLVEQNNYVQSYRAHESAYSSLRNEMKAEFPDLPDFGSEGYIAAVEAAKLMVPNLDSDAFTPEQRMKTVVNLAVGRKAEAVKSAQALSSVAEKGKQLGAEAERKAQLGKGLGAGKSKGTIGQPKPKGNDDIFGEGSTEYRRREKF